MAKRCFICHRKMDEKTGLCTNAKCVRSQPLKPKTAEEKKEEPAAGQEAK